MKPLFVVAIVLTLLVPGMGRADDHPIATMVKAKLKDPGKPFTMIVTVKVKEGKGEAFEKTFAEAIKSTRKEPGNITYQLNRDSEESSKYMAYERWKNLDALVEHLKSEPIAKLLAGLPDLLDGAPDIKVMVAVGE